MMKSKDYVPREPYDNSALGAYSVLDLTDEKGAYCTKILADLGADVIKVERPEGDATRRIGPFKDDIPHPEKSLHFLYYNANKRSITLNLDSSDGKDIFRKLVTTTDTVVESFSPGRMDSLGFSYEDLKKINPGIVMASITGFGQSGPFKDYEAPEIVALAMAGPLYLSGEPDKRPCMPPGPLAYMTASTFAAAGVLTALYDRSLTGKGQWVEVSAQECALAHTDFIVPEYSMDGRIARRRGNHVVGAPGSIYPCKDGHIMMLVIQAHFWKAFLDWIGNPEVFNDPVWDPYELRQQHHDLIDPYAVELTKQYTKEELYREGQRRHIPLTPINTPAEYLADPQAKHRGFFSEVEHPDVGKYYHPGVPYKLSGTPYRVSRPAPRLGEHNLEVYCDELGFSREDLCILRAAGAI